MIAVVSIALLCLASPAFAQGDRGAITGLITDAAGAVVPNVEVVATHLETNTTFRASSTSVGAYRLPYLPPGTYKVTASLKGFKNVVVEQVVVAVAAVVTADLKLEVGSSTESVTVSADVTHLESTSSELGYTVSSADYHAWPVLSDDDGQRQIQSFIFNSLPGSAGDSYSGSINGGPQMSHEVYIEGISIGRADIAGDTAEFEPSVDAVSEFRLQTGGLSAAYGGGLTAVANFNIKSGTNQLHGTAYDYVTNTVLNANSFSNNAYGAPRAPFKQNSFGAAAGAPLLLPKIYNGKNRSFWFFTYEADRKRNGMASGYRTLPTLANQQGDFSAVPQAIYDPHTTALVDGVYIRTPFPGNKIPSTSISKVTANILKLAPIPAPTLPGLLRNIQGITSQPYFNLDTFGGKFDQTITEKHKLSFYIGSNERLRYNGAGKGYLPVPGSASGSFAQQNVHGTMVRVGYDATITPRLLNHLGVGYNRLNNSNSSLSLGQDWPTKIGLTGVEPTTFPLINWTGTTAQGGSLTSLGRSNAGVEPNGSTIVANDTTWIHGSHSIKWGAEIRKYFYNQDYRGNTSGTFYFGPAQTADPAHAGTTGYSFATFLLGATTRSSLTIDKVNPQSRIWTPAFYVADDWKVSRKLTVNLGLRWDIVGGVYEVNNYSSGFDPNTPNPGASNYPGALVFLSDLKRKSFQNTYYGELGPRLGFAYSVNSRLVVRGGYGLMYSPPIANNWGLATIDGYSGSNNFAASNRDPNFYWDNGYPAYTHTLPNKDPALDNGAAGITYAAPNSTRQPYAQNYTIGVQFSINTDTTITANYVGNRGSRLNSGNFANMNQLNPKYLSLGDTLLDDISQHPEIKLPYAGFSDTVAQALLPYPQYAGGGVSYQFPHFGSSDYHALQVVTSRRLSKGLGFLISYAFQKTLSNVDSAHIYYGGSSQDVYNRALEKSVASFDHTQQLRLTWIGELPFGKGRPFLNRGGILNQVIGGWTITANQQYQSGNPLSIGTSLDTSGYLFNGTIRADVVAGQPLRVNSSGRLDIASGTGIQYINPKAFAEPPTTAGGVVAHLGTSPRYFGNLRGPYLPSENFGIFKRFPFGEGKHVEFRTDMFNVFNRSGLGDPITTVGDPQFGQITTVQSGPREIQVALRVTF